MLFLMYVHRTYPRRRPTWILDTTLAIVIILGRDLSIVDNSLVLLDCYSGEKRCDMCTDSIDLRDEIFGVPNVVFCFPR